MKRFIVDFGEEEIEIDNFAGSGRPDYVIYFSKREKEFEDNVKMIGRTLQEPIWILKFVPTLYAQDIAPGGARLWGIGVQISDKIKVGGFRSAAARTGTERIEILGMRCGVRLGSYFAYPIDKIIVDEIEKIEYAPRAVPTQCEGLNWKDLAKVELEAHFGIETEVEADPRPHVLFLESLEGPAENGEREWVILPNSEAADEYARVIVHDDLENDPMMFNSTFLWQHMDDEAFHDYLVEDYEGYCADYGDADLERYMSDEDLEAFDDAVGEQRANIIARAVDECVEVHIEDAERDGPEQYFTNQYGRQEGLRQAIRVLTLNVDAAAEAAVNDDGAAHFIDRYDGEEIELPSGAIAFGVN